MAQNQSGTLSSGHSSDWVSEDRGAPKTKPDGPKFKKEEEYRPTTDEFMTLFLCGLVLQGKRAIWIRGDRQVNERHRMYALDAYMNNVCDRERGNRDLNYFHFLVRLRNDLAPGNIGGFDNFRRLISSKMSTIVSITLPYCDSYDLEISKTTAAHYIEHAEPRMKKLVEGAVAAYMAVAKK